MPLPQTESTSSKGTSPPSGAMPSSTRGTLASGPALCELNGLTTVAFPLISTGSFG